VEVKRCPEKGNGSTKFGQASNSAATIRNATDTGITAQKELEYVKTGRTATKRLPIGHIQTGIPIICRLTASTQAKIIPPIIADGSPPG
jgi:hypothetical protein